jgi:hypothetical protein
LVKEYWHADAGQFLNEITDEGPEQSPDIPHQHPAKLSMDQWLKTNVQVWERIRKAAIKEGAKGLKETRGRDLRDKKWKALLTAALSKKKQLATGNISMDYEVDDVIKLWNLFF